MQDDQTPLTYADAGVDIKRADQLVQSIKSIAKKTHRDGILAGIGGFGSLFEIPTDRYQKPVLVSGTDGVGTKLKLAIKMQQHGSIGIDLVAMCVNDIITLGAEPLYFLDYYATGKLDPQQAEMVIKGIGAGCELAGAALIGGETAEMPGMYQNEDYDLAGFCVGVVEKSNIIDGSLIQPKDAVIGIASSGPHSNGYSLIRKILERSSDSLETPFEDATLGDALLAPTKIYIKSLLALTQAISVHGLAHITGGGLLENIPRVLPKNTQAVIDKNNWEMPAIFDWLQQQGNIDLQEMYRTFNCGIGMVAIVAAEDVQTTLQILEKHGETAWHIGVINADHDNNPVVIK